MEDLNRFLPRVWTDEGYFYPVFSEFGLTYENPNKEFDEDNLERIEWVFSWCFGRFSKDENGRIQYIRNKNDNIEYVNQLEQCTGILDKNEKFIYENDIISTIEDGREGLYLVKYDLLTQMFVRIDKTGKKTMLNINPLLTDKEGNIYYSNKVKIIGNLNENKDLFSLEQDD